MRYKENIIFKILGTIIFMFFILSITINILYRSIKLSNEEYINLLLNDSFNRTFYSDIVSLFVSINPIDLISIPEVNKIKLTSNYILNPIIYVYSTDDLLYKNDLNYTPSTSLVAYLISNKLSNISTFESDVYNLKKLNNMNNNESISAFLDEDVRYKINICRSDFGRSITINNIKYATIDLYTNQNDISFINDLNEDINNKYANLSKIYLNDEDDIKICIGYKNSSMEELLNSIDVLTDSIGNIIYE